MKVVCIGEACKKKNNKCLIKKFTKFTKCPNYKQNYLVNSIFYKKMTQLLKTHLHKMIQLLTIHLHCVFVQQTKIVKNLRNILPINRLTMMVSQK